MLKIKTFEKEMRPIETLKGWEENPRAVLEDDLKRLQDQLGFTKGDLFKPITILEDGTVLGGNQRLKVLRKMGVKQVWVKVVHPKSEEEKIKIGMSDNGRSGLYDPEKLRAQVAIADWDEDLQKLFKADSSLPLTLPNFLEKKATQTLGKDAAKDTDSTKEKLERYQNGDQKQVVLFFLESEREKIEGLFSDLRERLGVDSNSQVLLELV